MIEDFTLPKSTFLLASSIILFLLNACVQLPDFTNPYDPNNYNSPGSNGLNPTPCPGLSTVTHEGKTYNTVQIGDQCWLKENLDVGTMIQGSQYQTNNSVIEKYCFNNDPGNCNIFGGLYQWEEAMQYVTNEGTQGICPPGWHIPTLAEFQTLSSTVSGDGNALKAIGQGTGSGAGTNTSEFSALLTGYKSDNNFSSMTIFAPFWSSTGSTVTTAYNLSLFGGSSSIGFNENPQNNGFVVRCIKD